MNIRRTGLVLIVALAVAAALAYGWHSSLGDTGRLELDHSIRLAMSRHAHVAELDIPDVPGLKMFLHPEDSVITYRIMGTRQWEPNETHWVSKFIREGDTFVDIGANVGYFTLLASKLVGPDGHVFAFEPDPVAFSILERNVRLNGLSNVTLEQKAVSNEPGTLKLYISEKNKGDHKIYETDEERPSIEVEAVPLDEYFADRIDDIDFVKIDTQGAEGVILEGMDAVIRANEDLVMAVEYWPHGLAGLGTNAAKFLRLLRSYDFLFFNLGPGANHLFPLKEVRTRDLTPRGGTTPENYFTNLLLIRGYERSHKLSFESLGAATKFNQDSPEFRAEKDAWITETRRKITEDGPQSVKLPIGMAFVLAKPTERRTPADNRAIDRYFRTIKPELAELREGAAIAAQALREYQSSLLLDRMRPGASLELPAD